MTRFVGKYQLIRKLAAGGMAEVYLAKAAGPHGFEKTLVVKCILPHLAQEPAFVRMFLSEAMLAARLNHSHIVQIYDFGEVDGSYFLAMEYIDGPSLRTLIKRASARGLPLPPTVCARLVSQACEGLAFAHDFADPETHQPLGLIHRDISPDNLLLTRQGSVKVVDFGIAKAAGQSHRTESGVVKGKLAYMPPEQVRARGLDRRADVYALGVVLYELLTSHKPYRPMEDAALMHAILFEPPTPAVQHRPDLPVALQRILARALAKERAQRYPDCHAFQSDLEEFILAGGRTVTASQVAQIVQQVTEAVPPAEARPEAVTEPDAVAEPFPSRAGARTREESATLLEDMVAPEDASLARPPRAALAPSKPPAPMTAQMPRARRVAWPWYAGVGALLLLAGGGLVLGQRSGAVEGTAEVTAARPSAEPPSPRLTPRVEAPREQVAETVPAESPPPERPSAPSVAPASSEVRVQERTARASKPRRLVPAALGTLDVRAQPYANISVDGTPQGATPLETALELPAGPHSVTFSFPTVSRTVTRRVEVKAGKLTLLNVTAPK